MASQILVSFEDKKQTIAEWVAALSGIPIDNIAGVEEWGKLPYPAAYLSKVTETNLHRPIRVSEEIDDQLKSVVYSSKQVQIDIIFVTKDLGDYSDVTPENYKDSEFYANSLQSRLYDAEESLAFLKADSLSLQSDGPIRKRDEQREDGWLRKQIIEIGFGYVQQTAEDQYEIESIENVKSTVYIACPDGAPPDCSPQEIIFTVTFVKSVETRVGDVVLDDLYAALDTETGKLTESQALLPDIFKVTSELEQLALEVKQGDLCIRVDESRTYVALNNANEDLTDWELLLFTGDSVKYRFVTKQYVAVTAEEFDLLNTDQDRWLEFDNGANDTELTILDPLAFEWDVGSFFYSSKLGTGEVSYLRGPGVIFKTELPGSDVDFKIASDGTGPGTLHFVYRGSGTFYVFGPIKSL